MKKKLAIAVDGPAGSGKSTVAETVAKRLGLYHLDTGAMYRAIGYTALQNGISHNDIDAVKEMLNNTEIVVKFDADKTQRVFINGDDVTGEIRRNEVSKAASDFATVAVVRERLVDLQQKIAAEYPIILDGRDICRNVLPNADVKVFLTAAPEERARRRLSELHDKGQELDKTLDEMITEITERDKQDMNRAISPLSKADDAVLIDSTSLTIEQVCQKIIDMAERI